MLVHVTCQQRGEEPALHADIEIPDEIENDDVADYLEKEHGATVQQWTPLTRRADTTTSQPLACPHCGSDQIAEIGYVDYRSRGQLMVDSNGTEFRADGDLRRGEDYHRIAFECADCGTCLQTLEGEPFDVPDAEALRARLAHELQQIAYEEQEHPARDALDYEDNDGMLPNLEPLTPVEGFHAGVEAGIELATGAALRAACGKRAYIARNDWRLRLLKFARTALNENGARLIILRAGGNIDVASRVYPETAYETPQRMMDVACTRQTRVQNETDANVYVARRYSRGLVIYTGRHCILIDDGHGAVAAATKPSAAGT